MTFSIVARCALTGQFGIAIASSSPAVGARCTYALAGVGAVASQNVTDPRLGPQALHLMAQGASAPETIAILAREAPHAAFRQILAVDKAGRSGVHSGPNALGVWADACGPDVAAGGNMLANPAIPQTLVDAFTAANGPLGSRLIRAMRAGLALGGEAGPIHSSGLKIVDTESWPLTDLRCDWTESCPIDALGELWALWEPQMRAYVTRALNPATAPSYGVPGNA